MWPLRLFGLAFLALALAADYYETLGVSRDASVQEIKKAYRALSRQYHPDKNKGDKTAEQKFIEIATAYEVLSDKDERAKYDRYGEEGLKGDAFRHQDPMDLFSHFFGFGRNSRHAGRRRGPDARAILPVSLVDTYKGRTVEFSVQLDSICFDCDGTGSADGKRSTCKDCGGTGMRIIERQLAPGMFQRLQTTCDACQGKGSTISHPCGTCHGQRVVPDDRKYNVIMDAGAAREWDYVLEGEGEQNPDWEAGNLVVHVVESSEHTMGYRRRGNHLFRDEILSARQAQKGDWERKITLLDEETTIRIGRKSGERIVDGQWEIISGEGMPIPESDGEHGDLYIRYIVVSGPYSLNSEEGHNEL